MQSRLIPPILAVALALGACSSADQEAARPAATGADAVDPDAQFDARDPELLPPDAPLSPDDGASFDMRGLAGTFTGTLPCASCPGIDTTLVLGADGTYELTEAYQDEPGPAIATEGSWSVEEDDTRIRLDPASKAAEDRLLEIESRDRVVFLTPAGERAESGLDYGLERRAQ